MIPGRLLVPLLGIVAVLGIARADDVPPQNTEVRVPLQFEGGHKTEPVDRGRPVILVASALNVPPAVFREAFGYVHPAGPGQQPQPDDVRQNKRELLSRLEKYGVANQRLDEVSNYYRYPPGSRELWRHVDATGFAIIRGGKVVRIEITRHGAGYTTAPLVTAPGAGLTQFLVAKLDFNMDLARNGSVASITTCPIDDLGPDKQPHVPNQSATSKIENGPDHGPPPPSPPVTHP